MKIKNKNNHSSLYTVSFRRVLTEIPKSAFPQNVHILAAKTRAFTKLFCPEGVFQGTRTVMPLTVMSHITFLYPDIMHLEHKTNKM